MNFTAVRPWREEDSTNLFCLGNSRKVRGRHSRRVREVLPVYMVISLGGFIVIFILVVHHWDIFSSAWDNNRRGAPSFSKKVIIRNELRAMSLASKIKFVKERVVLSSLLSRYADLVPAGEASFKTLCLFHDDNNPSMMVNDIPESSPYFYCFSCGESGDFLKILSRKANISYGAVLGSSFDALSTGVSVQEWIESFEKQHGIVSSQRLLIPRSSLVNRKATTSKRKAAIERDPSDPDTALADEDFGQFEAEQVLTNLDEANTYFSTRLLMDPSAYFVRTYLKDRGISAETAIKFGLGYAPTMRLLKARAPTVKPPTRPNAQPLVSLASSATPAAQPTPTVSPKAPMRQQSLDEAFQEWTAMQGTTLTDWLLRDCQDGTDAQQTKLRYMVHAGLTVNTTKYLQASSEGSGDDPAGATAATTVAIDTKALNRRQTHYDRFRNRLMIPIRNQDGKVIGFGGRELPLPRTLMTHEELRQLEMETKQKKAVAKYINSPSSVVFIKKKTLFGIDLAAPYCEEAGCVIMVEGYFDVIACHQANVRNVVASMGTSVTLEQLLSAAKLTSKRTIVLLLDNDEAGRKAAARAKKIADKHHEEAMKTLRLRPDGDVVDEEDIRQEHFITLKRATIDDALSFIRREKLKTTLRRVYDPQQKALKDCADICEIFPAESARKIIRHIADSAVLVDHDAEVTTHAASDKDTSLLPSPPPLVKTKPSPLLERKPAAGGESTWKVNAPTSPTTVAVEDVLPPVRRKYTPRLSSPPPNATTPPPVNAYPRKYVKQSSSPSSSSYARTQQSSTPVIRRDRHPQPQQSYDDIV